MGKKSGNSNVKNIYIYCLYFIKIPLSQGHFIITSFSFCCFREITININFLYGWYTMRQPVLGSNFDYILNNILRNAMK